MISSLRRLGVEDKTHALGTEATHGQMELRVKSGNALRNRLGVYTRSTVDAFRPLLLSRSRLGRNRHALARSPESNSRSNRNLFLPAKLAVDP